MRECLILQFDQGSFVSFILAASSGST